MFRKAAKITYMTIKGIAIGTPVALAIQKSCKQCFQGSLTELCLDFCPLVIATCLPSLSAAYISPLVFGPKTMASVYGTTRLVYRIATAPTSLTAVAVDRLTAPVEQIVFGEPLPVAAPDGLITFEFSK